MISARVLKLSVLYLLNLPGRLGCAVVMVTPEPDGTVWQPYMNLGKQFVRETCTSYHTICHLFTCLLPCFYFSFACGRMFVPPSSFNTQYTQTTGDGSDVMTSLNGFLS